MDRVNPHCLKQFKANSTPVILSIPILLKDKIVERYTRTLDNLLPAMHLVEKAYLFDNSGETMLLIAETTDGQLTTLVEQNQLPNWFIEYIINKLS